MLLIFVLSATNHDDDAFQGLLWMIFMSDKNCSLGTTAAARWSKAKEACGRAFTFQYLTLFFVHAHKTPIHLTCICTHTYTHKHIFYGVHARLHLLYKVLLEQDHKGWDWLTLASQSPPSPSSSPTSVIACGTSSGRLRELHRGRTSPPPRPLGGVVF